VNYTEY